MKSTIGRLIPAVSIALLIFAYSSNAWSGPRVMLGTKPGGFSSGRGGLSISGHPTNGFGNFYKGPHSGGLGLRGTYDPFRQRGFRGRRGFTPQSFNGSSNYIPGPGSLSPLDNTRGRTVFTLPNHYESANSSPGIPLSTPRSFGGLRHFPSSRHNKGLVRINPNRGIIGGTLGGSGTVLRFRHQIR